MPIRGPLFGAGSRWVPSKDYEFRGEIVWPSEPEGRDPMEDPPGEPLAVYVPYKSEWGIHFHMMNMVRDFVDFCNNLSRHRVLEKLRFRIWSAAAVYTAVIYIHEVTHHIVQDICTIKNVDYRTLSVPRYQEENLCDYTAFTLLELYRKSLLEKLPHTVDGISQALACVVYPTITFFERPRWRLFRDIPQQDIKELLDALYWWWDKGDPKRKAYKPIVEQEILEFLDGHIIHAIFSHIFSWDEKPWEDMIERIHNIRFPTERIKERIYPPGP